jgi:protein-S-isoprenylcysteine O-methyltransferase Ste14
MQRKKTLADYWALVLLFFALLLFWFGYRAPQADEAHFYVAIGLIFLIGFFVAIYWSKRRLGEFFSNMAGGR